MNSLSVLYLALDHLGKGLEAKVFVSCGLSEPVSLKPPTNSVGKSCVKLISARTSSCMIYTSVVITVLKIMIKPSIKFWQALWYRMNFGRPNLIYFDELFFLL